MATREAALKVTLKPGAFKAGLRKMTSMTRSAGGKMGSALKGPLKDGFKEAGAAAKNMLGSITDAVKVAASLGGAFSAGAAVKGAVESEEAYLRLGLSLTEMGDKAVSAAEAQEMVQRTAKKTKVELGQLQEMASQLTGLGGGRFEKALERAAAQSHRLGADGQMVAEVYSVLLTKGLAETGNEAELATERLVKLGRSVLGLNIEDALNPADIAEFAAFTNRAGEDLNTMLNLLEASGGAGVKDFGEAIELLEEFSNVLGTTKGFEEIRKGAKLTTKEFVDTGNSVENFVQLTEIGGKKGQKAMTAFFDAFGSEKAQTMIENLFGKDLVLQIRRGEADQDDIDVATGLLTKVLDKRTETEKVRKRIAEDDAKFQKTNAAKMRDAMNDLHKAFASPEMIAAVTELTKLLPDLVAGLTELLKLVAQNPKEALATVVLGQVGMVFAGAAVQSAAAAGVKALLVKMGITAAAGGAVSTAGGAVAGAGGAAAAGGGATAAIAAAVAVAGTSVAALSAGVLAAGVAIAGVVGVAAGTAFNELVMDPAQQKEFDAIAGATNADTRSELAMGPKSTAKEVETAIVDILKAKSKLEESESVFNTVFGNMAAIITDVKDPAEMRKESMDKLNEQEARLREKFSMLAGAADVASKALRNTPGGGGGGGGGGNTTRGPRVPPNPQPGASPVGG